MNFLTRRMGFALTFFVLAGASSLCASKPCRELLFTVGHLDDHAVLINGILASQYMTFELDEMRAHLGLSDSEARRFAGKKIISVGEGKSPLLPFLIGLSFETRAVDLWYDKPAELNQTQGGRSLLAYAEQFGGFLIAADATNIPIASDSVDLVVSHHLVNNFDLETGDFDIEKTVETYKEALRITKVGGEV